MKKLNLFSIQRKILDFCGSKNSYRLLSTIACLESFIFPIPPDPLLALMVIKDNKRALRIAFLCTISSLIGGIIGYVIGYSIFALFDEEIISLFASMVEYEHISRLYSYYGAMIVIIGAFTIMPFKVFTILSGFFGLNIFVFTIFAFLGRGLRFFLLALIIKYLGLLLGEKYMFIISMFFSAAVLLFLLLYLVFM